MMLRDVGRTVLFLACLVVVGCGGGTGGVLPDDGGAAVDGTPDGPPAGHDAPAGDAAGWDAGLDAGADAADATAVDASQQDAVPDDGPVMFVTVTMNGGIHPPVGSGGITSQQNQYLADYYGSGLVWQPAIAEAQAFLAGLQPDVVTFQEVFYTEECADVPVEARQGFVCETWTPGAPTVEQTLLGAGYQVACNWHKTDKCAAVKKQFGTFRGCSSDLCMDGLYGSTISGCGSGARIGRGLIDLVRGGTITLVNVHGSSGEASSDMDCRTQQIDQVFVDVGDGAPAANGALDLIQGDFNTDPRSAVALLLDASARRWADFVGPSKPFHFVNEYVKTYPRNAPVFAIDNVVSDALTGTCWHPGVTSGHPAVSPEGYFDHTPTVCTITVP